MDARLIYPYKNYTGNLLWREAELIGHEDDISNSIVLLKSFGYWASAYPEGDGVTFTPERNQTNEQIFLDISQSFPWLHIKIADSKNSNAELAELEEQAGASTHLNCIVIVPLERVHFEESFELGPFRFVPARQLQSTDEERLADHAGAYIQFNTDLNYADLLRVRRSVQDDDLVINKCLSLAEHAMDVIRFAFSSFSKQEFTPNPAGQLDEGIYSVEIIPLGDKHLKPMNLTGISRPMSASNNWLGPEIEDISFASRAYLTEVLMGRNDQIALSVKSALRGCRQSFYSLGDESKFLNLVFTLDGLAHPEKWTGWKQRTYIAALVSKGNLDEFSNVLQRYDTLYEIRNALVHKGRDFYELGHSPAASCQELYDYIQAIVELVSARNVQTVAELHDCAKAWLSQPTWQTRYLSDIGNLCSHKGIPVQNLPNW